MRALACCRVPNLLTYVDGGFTQAKFDQSNLSTQFTVPALPTGDPSGHTFNGWFIGGGTEYAFTWLPVRGLFWRTEYRYSMYQSADVPSFFTATGVPDRPWAACNAASADRYDVAHLAV